MAVVLRDGVQRFHPSSAHKVAPGLGYQVAGEIVFAHESQQPPLRGLQAAIVPAVPAGAACKMQQVDMGLIRERIGLPGKPITGNQQRHIETLAIVRNQVSRGLDPATDCFQQRRLPGETRQYPLPQLQLFPLDARKAYHERQGAGAAGKARGLGIQEQQSIRQGLTRHAERREGHLRQL